MKIHHEKTFYAETGWKSIKQELRSDTESSIAFQEVTQEIFLNIW